MMLLRIGVRLSAKKHEKVPATLAGGETDIRSHLCRERQENYVPWAQLEHANPDADFFTHVLLYGAKTRNSRGRGKKEGQRRKSNLTSVLVILIIGN
jgi:hypothetical protein